MLLGCIGDDLTGSGDLGNALVQGGLASVLYCGIPDGPTDLSVDCGIVALKSRSLAPAEAVRQSLAALEWLLAQGCRQIVFKYCSTFDSTPDGNIGPVAEALADRLDAREVLVCPAFPGAGRTVYQGHLFVNDRLLSESGMEHHPLTPMTDPDLRRWLALQVRGEVGHVPLSVVDEGAEAIRARFAAEGTAGRRLIVCDAVRDSDLVVLGRAAEDLPLVTGGSGIALGLPENFRRAGALSGAGGAWPGQSGPAAVLAGSCSAATRAQVAAHACFHPARQIGADEIMSGQVRARDLADWALAQDDVPLLYSSVDPGTVRAAQARHGTEQLARAFEALFGEIAVLLVEGGITRLIAAGGETSGAVVEGLALRNLRIGPEICPGVPAMHDGGTLAIVLKSGNFGGENFFEVALLRLKEGTYAPPRNSHTEISCDS